MKEKITVAVFIIVLFVAFGMAGRSDYENFLMQQDMYCEGRQIWESEKQAGIPVDIRNGYPPYREDYYECN
jgi:hypothetical protein